MNPAVEQADPPRGPAWFRLSIYDAPMTRALGSSTRAALCLAAVPTLFAALLVSAPSTSALDSAGPATRCCKTGPDGVYTVAPFLITATNHGSVSDARRYATSAVVTKLFNKRKAGAAFASPRCARSGEVVKCTSAMTHRRTKKSMGTARLTVTGDGAGKVTYASV